MSNRDLDPTGEHKFKPGDKLRRFTTHGRHGKPLRLWSGHPAVVNGTTLFPTRRIHPSLVKGKLFKSARNNRKIGAMVMRGRWAGMPIYTLTLEERATCPRTCPTWNDCYGNHMHFSPRHEHGEALEDALGWELHDLAATHLKGFVVRLHVLGDFYSVEYVRKWERWLRAYPGLHVFGYTARRRDDPIGAALLNVRRYFRERWWVRTSNFAINAEPAAVTVDTIEDAARAKALVCPAQTDKTACCSTCGLCWTTPSTIAFLKH